MKRFNVFVPKEDGGVEVYPMKQWLRHHPEHIPSRLDATNSTSHQLRDGLRRNGWTLRETPTETQLVMPGHLAVVDEVFGTAEDDEVTAGIPDPSEAQDSASFQLEYQLRDFLAQNLHTIKIEDRRLRIFVDPNGRDGIEFPTPVGLIDILAVDERGQFFVFELKRAASPDYAIGQLARYMGWVKQVLAQGKDVHGIIVARSITDRLKYAASVVPHVSLFEYEVEFHLRAAHEMEQRSSPRLAD